MWLKIKFEITQVLFEDIMSNAPQDARCLEFAEYVLENYIED